MSPNVLDHLSPGHLFLPVPPCLPGHRPLAVLHPPIHFRSEPGISKLPFPSFVDESFGPQAPHQAAFPMDGASIPRLHTGALFPETFIFLAEEQQNPQFQSGGWDERQNKLLVKMALF